MAKSTPGRKAGLLGAILVTAIAWLSVHAQPAPVVLLSQSEDGGAATPLASAQLAELNDPLFNLVLRDHADTTKLDAIEDLIQPDKAERQLFVVDEDIRDPTTGQSRRTVHTFTGIRNGESLSPNVMLSTTVSTPGFADPIPFIEAWGWDSRGGRYNYYKLDRSTGGALSWKFRTSSVDADSKTAGQRSGTCLACHVNGGPVMKELAFPWNNWHSFKSPATYLQASGTSPWPVANSERFKSGLRGAEDLETNGILPSTTQFNGRRVNASIKRDASGTVVLDSTGFAEIIEGRRLLRSLFVTTGYNIISSAQASGLHPFPNVTTAGPAEDIQIPPSFFLNVNILAGGTPAAYIGVGATSARGFSQLAPIKAAEYRALVSVPQTRLGGKNGDANFAWLVPEASHIDNDKIDRVMRQGIATPQFIASVLSVDLENPIMSSDRESLLAFVPNEFRFQPLNGTNPLSTSRHPDDLTRRMIAAMEQPGVSLTPVQRSFLMLLKDADPSKKVTNAIDVYVQRVKTLLNAPATRSTELKRLYDVAVRRRRSVLADSVLKNLNETGNRLFPLP